MFFVSSNIYFNMIWKFWIMIISCTDTRCYNIIPFWIMILLNKIYLKRRKKKDEDWFYILQRLLSFLLIDEDQFPTNNVLLLQHPNLIFHQKSIKMNILFWNKKKIILIVLHEHYSLMFGMVGLWMVNVFEFLVHYSNERFYEISERKKKNYFQD